MKKKVEKIELLVERAFDAGAAYSLGSHGDFQQIHPNRKQYMEAVSKKYTTDVESYKEECLRRAKDMGELEYNLLRELML
jgi:hypothetical protein